MKSLKTPLYNFTSVIVISNLANVRYTINDIYILKYYFEAVSMANVKTLTRKVKKYKKEIENVIYGYYCRKLNMDFYVS